MQAATPQWGCTTAHSYALARPSSPWVTWMGWLLCQLLPTGVNLATHIIRPLREVLGKKTRAGPLPSAHTLTGQSVGGTDGHSLAQVAGAQQTGQAGSDPDIAAREQASDDLVYGTHQTLGNVEKNLLCTSKIN